MNTNHYLRTGELCQQAGINPETLRFTKRSNCCLRRAALPTVIANILPDSLLRLQFIQQAKLAGFTLAEMAALLLNHRR